MTRCLGIDASTNKTGVCIMEYGKILHYGVIDLSKHSKDYLERIQELKNRIEKLIQRANIGAVAIEDTTLKDVQANNVDVFKKLTKNLGCIEIMLLENDIAFQTIKAGEWRKGKELGSRRQDQKKNAVDYVNKYFELDLKYADDDIAEAILIALYLDNKINT